MNPDTSMDAYVRMAHAIVRVHLRGVEVRRVLGLQIETARVAQPQ